MYLPPNAVRTTEEPVIQPVLSGIIGYYCEAGFHEPNEDLLYINPELEVFACIDGMGGHEGGDFASGIIAQTIDDFARDIPIEKGSKAIEEWATKFHKVSSDKMRESSFENPGASYTMYHIEKTENGLKLHVFYAGDVVIRIQNRSGAQISIDPECSKIPRYSNLLNNAILADDPGEPRYLSLDLSLPTRLIVASDGLWDNLPPLDTTHALLSLEIYEDKIKETTKVRSLSKRLREKALSSMKSEKERKERIKRIKEELEELDPHIEAYEEEKEKRKKELSDEKNPYGKPDNLSFIVHSILR